MLLLFLTLLFYPTLLIIVSFLPLLSHSFLIYLLPLLPLSSISSYFPFLHLFAPIDRGRTREGDAKKEPGRLGEGRTGCGLCAKRGGESRTAEATTS